MDDSESSDIFSEPSGNNDSRSITVENYEVLMKKIKAAENIGAHNVKTTNFNSILDDCKVCIDQQLNQINTLLEDTDTQIDKLCGYIEDAVCILQILSNFVKAVFESVAHITCGTVKYFSTHTGNIILSVFTHCKDSECIYGDSLCIVEKQLKDLFRNCHELQLTYLNALEKDLIFDLTEMEDQEILIKTLEINLRISKVVQSLDVKTMAEQWKAYIMICEKYSYFLLKENIYNTTSKLLVSTTVNNIRTALETNEDDKMVLRSLKVANFSLKILLRICNLFKGSLNNRYDHIIKLLLSICLCKSSYYEIVGNRSSGFTILLNTNISMPLELLIDSLLEEEESFLNLIFQMSVNELKDSDLLGYMLLIIMMMKASLQKDVSNHSKLRIVAFVFTLLPYYHKWFNIGLKFNHSTEDNPQSYGLYEDLLLHTLAISTTLSSEGYRVLEGHLYKLLLGTEYYSALFASNLWVLLCRPNNHLLVEVLSGLLRVYQKLGTHALFPESPQRIHLTHTIQMLFHNLNKEGRMQIYKIFSVTDRKNVGIWTALETKNLQLLSNNVLKSVDRYVWDSLFESFNDVGNAEDGMEDLIKYLKLASTCTFVERDSRKEQFLMKAWTKACPTCNNTVLHRSGLIDSSIWLFRYLDGLASLTASYMQELERKTLVNILSIISKYLQKGNMEIIYLLFKLFCKLLNLLMINRNDVAIMDLFIDTIRTVLQQDSNETIEQYVCNVIVAADDLAKTLAPILQDAFTNLNIDDYKNKFGNNEEWGKQLHCAVYNNYTHKCTETTQTSVMEHNYIDSEEIKEGNFDLGDVDSLFDVSDGEEPASKKIKLDFDVDNLIGRIESDVEQVCQVKENVLSEYKSRIKCVCDKLRNIVS